MRCLNDTGPELLEMFAVQFFETFFKIRKAFDRFIYEKVVYEDRKRVKNGSAYVSKNIEESFNISKLTN